MATNQFLFFPGRLHVVAAKYAEFGGPWPQEPGVELSVVVTTTGGFITGIWTESEQSELYSFSDDTGLDLLRQGGGGSAGVISDDRKAALFAVVGRVPPAPTASRIVARGRILISTASGTQPHRSGAVPAEEGAKASVAGFEFRIGSVAKSEFDEAGLEIEFNRSAKEQRLRDVSRIWFEDGAGRRLQVEEAGCSAHGVDDDYEVSDKFVFRDEVKEFVVVVELWEKRVEQPVEYEVSSTIGCGG